MENAHAGLTQDNVAEEQAFQLAQCAIAMDKARGEDATGSPVMMEALKENLEAWVAVRTLASRNDCGLSEEIRKNLITLSRFVAERTFSNAGMMKSEILSTLININLQISEGLLEGQQKELH